VQGAGRKVRRDRWDRRGPQGLPGAGGDTRRRPSMLPHQPTASQRATVKYFIVISLLFLAQVLFGGGVAHFRLIPRVSTASIFPGFSESTAAHLASAAGDSMDCDRVPGRGTVYSAITRRARSGLPVFRG